jgi:hypothetical protein
VIALCLVSPLVLDLVAASKVAITALGGATQLNDAYGSPLSSSSIGSVL